MFNQPLLIARKNRGSADLFPKGFSLPFEIRFHATGGFVRERYGFIHAAGRGSEESCDGVDADTWAVEYRSVKRRMRSKSLAEFRGAICSDECNPVVSWCALIHDGIPLVWDASPRRSLRQLQTLCDAEKEIRELSQDRSSFLHQEVMPPIRMRT
jgi:hypothetical protein